MNNIPFSWAVQRPVNMNQIFVNPHETVAVSGRAFSLQAGKLDSPEQKLSSSWFQCRSYGRFLLNVPAPGAKTLHESINSVWEYNNAYVCFWKVVVGTWKILLPSNLEAKKQNVPTVPTAFLIIIY